MMIGKRIAIVNGVLVIVPDEDVCHEVYVYRGPPKKT